MFKTLIYEAEVIEEIFVADSFMKRLLGYMFRKNPHYEGILFEPCNSIHTFFMRFPIDVLFINDNMEVTKKISGLKAGKVIMPQKEVTMVIEGKEGTFKNIKEGDKLILIN